MDSSIKIFLGLVILLVLIFGTVIVSNFVKSSAYEDYCEEYHPSIDGSYNGLFEFGSIRGIEDGFIKCCRIKYVNHEGRSDCKILEYEK